MTNRFFFLMGILVTACSHKQSADEQIKQVHYFNVISQSNSGMPSLFTDKAGNVYLSWIEKGEKHSSFKFSTLQGDRWSPPILIASDSTWFVNWADYPMLAANGNQLAAFFLDRSGESTYAYDVKLTLSSDTGHHWLRPIVLHDDQKQAEHGFVTILPYGNNFFVTWLDGRNTVMEGMAGMDHDGGHHGAMSLRAAVIDIHGNKINEWELDNKTCDCCQTSAAITSIGPVVVYRDRSDEEIRDMAIVRLIDGQWTKPKPIQNDHWKIAGCPVNGPRAASDGNNLAVAWFTAASDSTQVKVIFSADGGATFGKPIRLDEGHTIGRVDVVLLSEASAMVSWMEGSVIKVAQVYANGKKEASMTIASSSESRSSGFPQMTRTANQLIVAWTDDKEKIIKVASIPL